MAAHTAGLSRAYSVLRQLEKLREHDIVDPLLPMTAWTPPPLPLPPPLPDAPQARKPLTAPGPAQGRVQDADAGAAPMPSTRRAIPRTSSFRSSGEENSAARSGSRHSSAASSRTAPSATQPASASSSASSSHRSASSTRSAALSDVPPRPTPVVAYVQKRISDTEDADADADADADEVARQRGSTTTLHLPPESSPTGRPPPGLAAQPRREVLYRRTPRGPRTPQGEEHAAAPHKEKATPSAPEPPAAAHGSPLSEASSAARFRAEEQRAPAREADAVPEELFFDADAARDAAVAAASGAIRQMSLPYRESALPLREPSASTQTHSTTTTTTTIGDTRSSAGSSATDARRPSLQNKPAAAAPAAPPPSPPALPTPQTPASVLSPSSSVSASVAYIESFIDSDGEHDDPHDEPLAALTAPPPRRHHQQTAASLRSAPRQPPLPFPSDNAAAILKAKGTGTVSSGTGEMAAPPPPLPTVLHDDNLASAGTRPPASLLPLSVPAAFADRSGPRTSDTSVEEQASSILDHYRGAGSAVESEHAARPSGHCATPANTPGGSLDASAANHKERRAVEVTEAAENATCVPAAAAPTSSSLSASQPPRASGRWAAWHNAPAGPLSPTTPVRRATAGRQPSKHQQTQTQPQTLASETPSSPPPRLMSQPVSTVDGSALASSFSPSPRKQQQAVAGSGQPLFPGLSDAGPGWQGGRESRRRRHGRSGSGSRRHTSPPPPPVSPTLHVPLLAYVEELNAAGSHTLQKEVAAMQPTCNDTDAADCLTDCLALTVLINKRVVLRHVVVPMLVETLLRASIPPTEHHDASHAQRDRQGRHHQGRRAASWVREPASPAEAVRHAAANQALCAIIGLGEAAAEALPVLREMLERMEGGDARLVALAIRCVGGADGLKVLEDVADAQARMHDNAEVRCAALYGLGALPHSVLGHTTVLCVMDGDELADDPESGNSRPRVHALNDDDEAAVAAGEVERSPSPQRRRPALQFYAEPTPDGPYVEMTPVTAVEASDTRGGAREAVRAWQRLPRESTAPTSLPSSLQARPPYTPTHILLHPAVAQEQLVAFLASPHFRPQRDYPNLVIVLRDFFLFFEEQTERRLSAVVTRSLREAEAQLGPFLATVEESLAQPSSVTMPLLLLPFAYDSHWVRFPDIIFRVEQCLLTAILEDPQAMAKEQALLSAASLPRAARPHVGQPVMDFALAYARRFERRWGGDGATADKAGITSAHSSGIVDAQEVAEEAVLVAAVVAVGFTSVSEAAGFAGVALQQQARDFLMQMLTQSSRWRLRHAACVGLGALGASTLLSPVAPFESPASAHALLLVDKSPSPPPASRGRRRSAASQRRGRSRSEAPHRPLSSSARQPTLPVLAEVKPVVDALVAVLQSGEVKAETVCWSLARQGSQGIRALLAALSDASLPPETHVTVAHALGRVDVHAAAVGEGGSPEEEDALLDEVIVGLTHAILSPGVLSEDAVLACVPALAALVDRSDKTAATPAGRGAAALDEDVDSRIDEAATYYKLREPNDSFLVLRSIIEASLFSFSVLRALFRCLCQYGGCYGEVYASQTVVESAEVPVRAAAAYGLRACGAKVARAVALAMSDDAPEVRREGFSTLEAIGIDAVASVVHHPRRPPLHRQQILAALRDCLLRDLGRGERRAAAQELYDRLTEEEKSPMATRRL